MVRLKGAGQRIESGICLAQIDLRLHIFAQIHIKIIIFTHPSSFLRIMPQWELKIL